MGQNRRAEVQAGKTECCSGVKLNIVMVYSPPSKGSKVNAKLGLTRCKERPRLYYFYIVWCMVVLTFMIHELWLLMIMLLYLVSWYSMAVFEWCMDASVC